MIEDILPRYQERANGSKTAFTVPFDVLDKNFLIVYKDKIRQESDSYSVAEKTITFNTAPANNTLITIQRVVPVEWTSSNYGTLNSETLGNILTRIVAEIQTVKEEVNRTPKTEAYDEENGSSLSEYFFEQMRESVDILEQFKVLSSNLASMKEDIDSYIEDATGSIVNYINNMTSDKIGEYDQNAASKISELETKTTYLSEIADETEYVFNHRDSLTFFKEWGSSRL